MKADISTFHFSSQLTQCWQENAGLVICTALYVVRVTLRHSDSSTVRVSLERQLVQIGDDIGVSLKPFICPKKPTWSGVFPYWFSHCWLSLPGQNTMLRYHHLSLQILHCLRNWENTTFLSTQLLRSGDDSRALRYSRVFLVTRWDSHPGLMPWRTVDECVVRPACTDMSEAGFSKAQMCLAW